MGRIHSIVRNRIDPRHHAGRLAGAMLWVLVSLAPVSSRADGDTQLIRIVRGGMAPVAAAAGETVEYRVDYEVLRPSLQRVEMDPGIDWSPLIIHSYRYLTNAEGKPSFRVVLRIPESLINTNGTDRWLFYSPRLRVIDTQANVQTLTAPPGVLLVLVRHALRTESGLTHYQNAAPGSWWLMAPDFLFAEEMDWETSLRDRSRVLLPPGVDLLLAGLDSRIVQFMLSFYGSAPSSGFLVFTEGPFELFAWDNRDRPLPEFRTRLIPGVRVGEYYTYQVGPTWALGVRARADARPGDAGKVVAVFLRENGEEWGRRELRLEAGPDPLQSMGRIVLANSDNEALLTAYLLGTRPLSSGGYLATLYAMKQFNEQWSSNGVISYELFKLTNTEPFIDWIESQCIPCFPGCGDCYVVSGSLTCETPNPFYIKLTYAPGTVVATGGINPFGTDGEHVGSLHLAWSRAGSHQVHGSALGPVEIRARFRPPARIEYQSVRAPTLRSSSIISASEVDPCPPGARSHSSLWQWQLDNNLFLWANADFDTQRFDMTVGEGGVPWIDPRLHIDADLSLPWRTPSDTPEAVVQLVANPPALRLVQLTPTNRPWVELLVQAREEDQPWAAQPVSVEGPDVGQLVLQEPRQTDTYGHYSFYWQPPPADWFEGRTLPYAFDFTVRLPGGRTSTAHVFVSQEVVRGRVVRRHAGADRSDPEGDGLTPVVGAEVSFTPSFNPGFTVRTDAEGDFVLPVQGAQLYTVYVRGPQTPPMTLTESDPILWVPGTQEHLLADPLYLASLSVLPKLKDIYLPPVRQYLQRGSAETWFSLESPTNPAPVIEAFLQRLQSQPRTSSYDEEALRRLHLATWVAYEGTRAAQEVSEFAADQIWEGSCGLLTRLLQETVKKIDVLQIIKGRLNDEIQRLTQSGSDPVRLRKLQDQLAMLEAAERKTLELKRRLNQAAYSLYSQVAVRLAKSGTEPRLVRQLFLQLMLYWNNQLNELVGEQIESWLLDSKLGRLATTEVSRRLNSVNNSLEQLDAQLREALRQYLALGFRRELGRALLEAALAADAGRFPQNAFSYAQADRAVGLAVERLQADIQWFRQVTTGEFGYGFWLELLNGVLDDWDNWAKAALTAVTVGTFAAWVKAIDAVLEVVNQMLPVAQVASGILAAEGISEDGSLTAHTVLGIRFALSQAGRFQVRVHSPVHLMAVDPWGRRTGWDASGTLHAEIPGALAQAAGPDQPEVLYLPDAPAHYRLLLFGTGSGTYRVEVGQEQAGGIFQTNGSWSGTISPGTVRSVQLTVSDSDTIQASPESDLPPPARWELRDENGEPIGHLHLASGGRVRLRPVLVGTDGLPVPVAWEELVWTASPTNVALLHPTESGLDLQAAEAGSTTVQLAGHGLVTNFTVTVTAAPPAVLALDVSPAIAAPGSVIHLQAQVTDGFNGLGGWTVHFHAPLFTTNPVATATTDASGRAEASWSLPAEVTGPMLLTATVLRPDGVRLTAGRRLGVLLRAGSLPGEPVDSATSITLAEENTPLAHVAVPSDAFPQAVQPVGFLEAIPDTTRLPALSGDWAFAKQPIALTFWDAARETSLVPSSPVQFTLNLTNRALEQTRVWQVVETNGSAVWMPVPNVLLSTNGWIFSMAQPGVLALLEDTRPPQLTNTVPVANSTNVSRTAPITLRFHEPIRPGAMWGQWVVQAGTNQIPVQVTLQDHTLTIVPQTPWRPATLHVLSLPTGAVTDLVGNPNETLLFRFTAQPPVRPRLQRPEVEQTPEGRRVRLRFAVEPDLGYVLETTDGLSGGVWVPVWASPLPVGTNQVEVADTVPANIPQRYYRLRIVW